jgi:hypothetical protein
MRFAEFPPEDDSPFSYAVRRRRDQLTLELRCDGEVEWALTRNAWTNEKRGGLRPASAPTTTKSLFGAESVQTRESTVSH